MCRKKDLGFLVSESSSFPERKIKSQLVTPFTQIFYTSIFRIENLCKIRKEFPQ